MGNLGYIFLGIGSHYTDGNGGVWNVNRNGEIAGLTPIGGVAPIPSATPFNLNCLKTFAKLKPLGLGTTGRVIANTLDEQLTMKEILANPALGREIMQNLSDVRWRGWSKMEYVKRLSNGKKITIHYVAKVHNNIITAIDDFKFK